MYLDPIKTLINAVLIGGGVFVSVWGIVRWPVLGHLAGFGCVITAVGLFEQAELARRQGAPCAWLRSVGIGFFFAGVAGVLAVALGII